MPTTATMSTALPTLPSVKTLTFGVEIETGIPYSTGLNVGGYHNGRVVPNMPERGIVSGKWKASSDGSINVANMQGVEFVSPVLRGADGLDNVAIAVERIHAMGAKVNRTCGVHVHVAFPTNDLAAVRRLVHLVAHWESALYATTGTKSREQNSYCRSIKTPSMRAARYGSMGDVRTAVMSNRYHTLNLMPILTGSQPTVEFRVFSGSVNAKKIVAWTMLALAIVEAALNGHRAKAFDMPETSVERECGEGRGERLVKAMLNDLFVWNGKSATRGQYGHETYTHEFMRKQLGRMAKKYDLIDATEID
jgi:hypothetical protein